MPDTTVHHHRDDVYFCRQGDGAVRVLAFREPPAERPSAEGECPGAVLDHTLTPSEWASVVAVVSAGGESGAAYADALALHQGVTEPVTA